MAFIGKQEPVTNPRRRGRKRRWTIAPLPDTVLTGFPGLPILDEFESHPELGIFLWQAFGDVWLWVRANEGERQAIFGSIEQLSGSLVRPAIPPVTCELPIRQIREALTSGDSRNARQLARSCEVVATWAERGGYFETAALYSLAAAHALPRNPSFTVAAARAERRCGRLHRAEELFERAVGLARRHGDHEVYSAAYLGWGLLEEQRANSTEARRLYVKALRAALRGGFRDLAGAARHNMIPLEAHAGRFEAGQAHIASALKLYGQGHASIPRLAADAACFWAWFGHFDLARSIYLVVADRIESFPDRVQVLANIARAAAALRDETGYEENACLIQELAGGGRRVPPRVWVDLAEGARTLGRVRAGVDLAGRALEEAQAHDDRSTLAAARAVLGAVQAEEPGDINREAPERLQRFVARFVRRLQEYPVCGEP